jgi:hypothetical protein
MKEIKKLKMKEIFKGFNMFEDEIEFHCSPEHKKYKDYWDSLSDEDKQKCKEIIGSLKVNLVDKQLTKRQQKQLKLDMWIYNRSKMNECNTKNNLNVHKQ